jgi:hypothetical protein
MKVTEKTEGIILLVIIVIFFGISMIPMVYWFNHPELTKMEIFKEYWQLYTALIIFIVGAQFIVHKNN